MEKTLESQTIETPETLPIATERRGLVPDVGSWTEAQNGALLLEKAAALVPITTVEEYKAIDTLIGQLGKVRNSAKTFVESFFAKHIANAKKAHQDLCDDRGEYIGIHQKPYEEAAAKATKLLRDFETAERARQAAAKKAAEDKARAEQEEANRKAEEDRKAQLAKDEEDRLAKAAKLEAEGKGKEAEKVLSAPPPPPPPPPRPVFSAPAYVPTELPKSKSAIESKRWTWEASNPTDPRVSLLELIAAAAANPDAFADFLTFDDKALKGRAKAKEAQARVPGIRFFNDPIQSVRAGR